MDGISADLVPVLKQLMPGFLAMLVFYWFAEAQKPTAVDRVLQALIGTAVVQIIVSGIEKLCYVLGNYYDFGTWDNTSADLWALAVATTIGLILAYLCNNDTAFSIARTFKLTTRASQDDAVHIHKAMANCGVVLHFSDSRRLMGYLDAYPSSKSTGVYLVSSPTWITGGDRLECPETQSIMINATDIQWVEFLN
ncbi:DUF6338 family protein [Pseudomonas sp. S3_B08]